MENSASTNRPANNRIDDWLDALHAPSAEEADSTNIQQVVEPSRPVSPPDAMTSLAEATARRGLNPLPQLDTRCGSRSSNAPALQSLLGVKPSESEVESPVVVRDGIREIQPSDFARDPMLQDDPPRNEHDIIVLRERNITLLQMDSDEYHVRDPLHYHIRHGANEIQPPSHNIGCGCPAGETVQPLDYYNGSEPDPLMPTTASEASRGVNTDRMGLSDEEDNQVRPQSPGILACQPHPGSAMKDFIERTQEERWANICLDDLDLMPLDQELLAAETRDDKETENGRAASPQNFEPDQHQDNPYAVSHNNSLEPPSSLLYETPGENSATPPQNNHPPGRLRMNSVRSANSFASIDLGPPAMDLSQTVPPAPPIRPVDSFARVASISTLNLAGNLFSLMSKKTGKSREPLMDDTDEEPDDQPGEPGAVELSTLDSATLRASTDQDSSKPTPPVRRPSRFVEHLDGAFEDDRDPDLERNASPSHRHHLSRYRRCLAWTDKNWFDLLVTHYVVISLLSVASFLMILIHLLLEVGK